MKRFIPLTTWLVALLIIAGALLMFESDFLWKLQDQNLFLNTKLFFNEQMVVPGGLLSWMGTYLTQYFYYPWLGTVLLSLCWLLMMWFTKRAFKLSNQWSALTLVPVALLLLTSGLSAHCPTALVCDSSSSSSPLFWVIPSWASMDWEPPY